MARVRFPLISPAPVSTVRFLPRFPFHSLLAHTFLCTVLTPPAWASRVELYVGALVPCLDSSCPPEALSSEVLAREFCTAFLNGMAGVCSCGFMLALGCAGAWEEWPGL